MITQKIAPHKSKYLGWVPHVNYTPQRQVQVLQQPVGAVQRSEKQFLNDYRQTNAKSKGEFAFYLRSLEVKGFRKGAYVVSFAAAKPYIDQQIHRVAELDEIHHFVQDWGTEYSGPQIITLEYFGRNQQPFKTCPGWYKPISEEELTLGWLERIAEERALSANS